MTILKCLNVPLVTSVIKTCQAFWPNENKLHWSKTANKEILSMQQIKFLAAIIINDIDSILC